MVLNVSEKVRSCYGFEVKLMPIPYLFGIHVCHSLTVKCPHKLLCLNLWFTLGGRGTFGRCGLAGRSGFLGTWRIGLEAYNLVHFLSFLCFIVHWIWTSHGDFPTMMDCVPSNREFFSASSGYFIRTMGKTSLLVSFPITIIKHPDKSKLSEKPFTLLHSSKL